MSKKSSKAKGEAAERRIVVAHHEAGIVARKVPQSGSIEGFDGDLTVADHFRGKVKARQNKAGFKLVADWIGPHDFLFLSDLSDPKAPPLVVMPFDRYLAFMAIWGQQGDQP